MEYLVTMTTHVPVEMPGHMVAGVRAHRVGHSSELAGQGAPAGVVAAATAAGESRSLGCGGPRDLAETQAILKPMPLDAWVAVQKPRRAPAPDRHPGLAAS